MQSNEGCFRARVAQICQAGEDVGSLADAAVSLWRDMSDALSPIIGPRGVAALYKRSLYLTRGEYPWLADAHEGVVLQGDYKLLHKALVQQEGPHAAAANAALLQTFYDLLRSLIGESLTERLLHPLWNNLSSGPAV